MLSVPATGQRLCSHNPPHSAACALLRPWLRLRVDLFATLPRSPCCPHQASWVPGTLCDERLLWDCGSFVRVSYKLFRSQKGGHLDLLFPRISSPLREVPEIEQLLVWVGQNSCFFLASFRGQLGCSRHLVNVRVLCKS